MIGPFWAFSAGPRGPSGGNADTAACFQDAKRFRQGFHATFIAFLAFMGG